MTTEEKGHIFLTGCGALMSQCSPFKTVAV